MKRRFPWFKKSRRFTPVGFHPTLGGVWFVVGAMLIGLAAMDADVNLLLVIFGFCLGGLIINFFYGWRTLPLLSVRRIVPETAVAGQPFVIRYAVTNRSRLAVARNIHIEDVLPRRSPLTKPEVFVAALPPGTTITLSSMAAPVSRGRLAFTSIRLSTRFPFHLFVKWVWRESRQEVIVFPALGRLTGELKTGSRSADAAGAEGSLGWARGDEEFYGVREYREGDNPRRIHWRRSARTGQLMIREMAQPRNFQFWCVLNTLIRPHDAMQVRRLDAAISAAATLMCEALESGAKIGLICNGDPFVVLPPGCGRAYRPRLLTELAIRGMNLSDGLAAQVHKLTWPARWHAPCVVFGANFDEDMRAAARALTRCLGPTSVYVPGIPAFDQLFKWTDNSEFDDLRTTLAKDKSPERRNGNGARLRQYEQAGVAR